MREDEGYHSQEIVTSESETEEEEGVEGNDGDLNENDEELEETGQNQSVPRRSKRVKRKPTYLDDYVLLHESECGRFLLVILGTSMKQRN